MPRGELAVRLGGCGCSSAGRTAAFPAGRRISPTITVMTARFPRAALPHVLRAYAATLRAVLGLLAVAMLFQMPATELASPHPLTTQHCGRA